MRTLYGKKYRYWEVKVVPVHPDHEIAQMELDDIALDGWKLVAVDAGKAFFTRSANAVTAAIMRSDASA